MEQLCVVCLRQRSKKPCELCMERIYCSVNCRKRSTSSHHDCAQDQETGLREFARQTQLLSGLSKLKRLPRSEYDDYMITEAVEMMLSLPYVRRLVRVYHDVVS